MCGIAGVFNHGVSSEEARKVMVDMISIVHYRGPDECGVYTDPGVGLGHVRLSIIGLDNGAQPMPNEDGSLWIVYNGEAFNYIELKRELVDKGHRFATETDTEVVLHLYEEYGPMGLNRLNGQFALAIWDRDRRELFLARDRVGIRPLFYARSNGRFIFASEIKSIFSVPGVEREIDTMALSEVFTLWSTLAGRTAFKGVFSLLPGHYMILNKDGVADKAYWSLPLAISNGTRRGTVDEAAEELASLLEDAVRLRLRADVPVGSYLSGGLDSSFISAIISGRLKHTLETFSMGFREEAFDESSYQEVMSKALGVRHRRVLIGGRDIAERLPNAVWHCECPLVRSAPVPLMILSGLARGSGYKVVLTGEGADEVFAGYNIFKEAKIRDFWSRRPESQMRPLLLKRLYPYIFKERNINLAFLRKFFAVGPEDRNDPLFSHRIRWNNCSKNATFFSKEVAFECAGYDPVESVLDVLPAGFDELDTLARAQWLETFIFLSNYLLSSQGDRVAMANSLEIRLPFLDYRVIEFAATLPAKWKMSGLNEKYILKRAAGNLLPDVIRERPKQPYRAPIQDALFGAEAPDFIDGMVCDSYIRQTGYFDPGKVVNLLLKFRRLGEGAAGEALMMAAMGIVTTQLLHYQFVQDFDSRKPVPIQPTLVVGNWP